MDRTGEMGMFVRAVECGSLAAAARTENLAPSAVSRIVSRLERRLGVRLLQRTTRSLRLTPEGENFYHRAVGILADLDAAEREVSGTARPAGRVSINSSASYVAHVLSGILPELLSRYPDIDLDVVQSDNMADLAAGTTDIAIRAGRLKNSSLIARSLGKTRLVVVAAPRWIEGQTTKSMVSEGEMLGFSYPRSAEVWGNPHGLNTARVRVSDGEGMRNIALVGVGPARLAEFTIRKDLEAGRLMRLEGEGEETTEEFHAVFVGPSKTLPSRVQAVLDFISTKGQVN